MRPSLPIAALLAVALGAGLRLVSLDDMEYKEDEAWLFHLVKEHVRDGTIHPLGMPSSQKLRVPGMSVWAFYPLGHVAGIDEPTHLARGVAVVNSVALMLLWWMIARVIPPEERRIWYWGLILVAVSPSAVILARKVWPPSLIPPFALLMVFGWYRRDGRAGALCWGGGSTLLGQMHVSGFLMAFALGLVSLVPLRGRVRWRWFAAGATAGALAMIPWMAYLVHGNESRSGAFAWNRLVEGKFWTMWVSDWGGLSLMSPLGRSYGDFLAEPFYLMGLFQLLAVGSATVVGLAALGRVVRRRAFAPGWRHRPVDRLLMAGFVGLGLMLALSGVRLHRHYLAAAFPLVPLSLARLAFSPNASAARARRNGACLGLLAVALAGLSAGFLRYVHVHGGVPGADYQDSYRARAEAQGRRPPFRAYDTVTTP